MLKFHTHQTIKNKLTIEMYVVFAICTISYAYAHMHICIQQQREYILMGNGFRILRAWFQRKVLQHTNLLNPTQTQVRVILYEHVKVHKTETQQHSWYILTHNSQLHQPLQMWITYCNFSGK